MRKSSQEQAAAYRKVLERLESDFGQMSRSNISKSVKDSIYTKMVQIKAQIDILEGNVPKKRRRRSKIVQLEAMAA